MLMKTRAGRLGRLRAVILLLAAPAGVTAVDGAG